MIERRRVRKDETIFCAIVEYKSTTYEAERATRRKTPCRACKNADDAGRETSIMAGYLSEKK